MPWGVFSVSEMKKMALWLRSSENISNAHCHCQPFRAALQGPSRGCSVELFRFPERPEESGLFLLLL